MLWVLPMSVFLFCSEYYASGQLFVPITTHDVAAADRPYCFVRSDRCPCSPDSGIGRYGYFPKMSFPFPLRNNRYQDADTDYQSIQSSIGIHMYIRSVVPENQMLIPLTHWSRVTHICVSDLTSIGSDNGLSPGQNQCWNIVNKTLRNKLKWIFSRNSNISIQENAFESVVCEKAAILSRPQWVISDHESHVEVMETPPALLALCDRNHWTLVQPSSYAGLWCFICCRPEQNVE